MEIEDIDRNEFFMQITKRICGSLDIETALWSCLKYLEGIMPVTGMNLHLFEQNLSEMRSIAQVTRYEVEKLDHIIPFPEDAKARLERDWPKLQDVMIVNRPELNPFTRTITRFAGKPYTSIMVIRLETLCYLLLSQDCASKLAIALYPVKRDGVRVQ